MIFLFWLSCWFVQLYFLSTAPWLGVVWPLFTVLTLFLSRRFIVSRLAGWLIILGVISDISSHLALGSVLRGYIVLAMGAIVVSVINNRLKITKFWQETLLVIILAIAVLLAQSTSLKVVAALFRYELWLYALMTAVLYVVIKLISNLSQRLES